MLESLQHWKTRVEGCLDQHLPASTLQPTTLHEAMRHATLSGGKRLRACLVYATGELLGVKPSALDAPAMAVELIHAYSLVHDDLPAMDDDALRRGQPTCHIRFGEAEAILAGDALQALAFQVLTNQPKDTETSATQRMGILHELALASGSRGMVGGQSLDLASEGKSLQLSQLENIHIHKTGALIRASVLSASCLASDCSAAQRQHLDGYAKAIGLAFQIRDDILDVEISTEELGKPSGSDQARNKATYPALMGITAAKAMAEDWLQQADKHLQDWGKEADTLRTLARWIGQRRH